MKRQPSLLLNIPKIRDLAFSRFWLANGAALAVDMPPELSPLLDTLHSKVLDIGPGSGDQLHRYSAAKVDAIYGAEPASKLHAQLLTKSNAAGFGGKYHILSCGAEPDALVPVLSKEGLFAEGSEGVFDDIVSIRVLCGVPDLKETVGGIYRLLKPGGRLIVMEHVVAQKSVIARFLQGFYMLVGRWKFWMGGCCLNRDTERALRAAGEWREVDLKLTNSWSTIPQIVGCLIKK
jgi:SAM-dependent methyltransferase